MKVLRPRDNPSSIDCSEEKSPKSSSPLSNKYGLHEIPLDLLATGGFVENPWCCIVSNKKLDLIDTEKIGGLVDETFATIASNDAVSCAIKLSTNFNASLFLNKFDPEVKKDTLDCFC